MAIKVIEDVYDLAGEKQVVLDHYDDGYAVPQRVAIHPWQRREAPPRRAVAVLVGSLTEDGDMGFDDDHEIAIVDYDDFIEGVLAVFPELQRVED